MGYSTDFVGAFKCSKTLTAEQRAYLLKFSDTRRVKRNPLTAERLGDPVREAVGLPMGKDGGYFTGGLGFAGQDHDASVLNGNEPPEGQPGLWCQWVPDETGEYIGWNGTEKFYNYTEWLQYIIDNFLTPWGITLTGVVRWQGEDRGDKGSIVVTESVIDVQNGVKVRLPVGFGKAFDNQSCLSFDEKPAKA